MMNYLDKKDAKFTKVLWTIHKLTHTLKKRIKVYFLKIILNIVWYDYITHILIVDKIENKEKHVEETKNHSKSHHPRGTWVA